MQAATSSAWDQPGHRPARTPGGGAAAHLMARPGQTVVCVHGEIDLATAGTLGVALSDAGRTPAPEVVVDLMQVRFMDSAGLELLIEHREQLAADGRSLVIHGASKAVRRLLEIAGTDHLLAAPG